MFQNWQSAKNTDLQLPHEQIGRIPNNLRQQHTILDYLHYYRYNSTLVNQFFDKEKYNNKKDMELFCVIITLTNKD